MFFLFLFLHCSFDFIVFPVLLKNLSLLVDHFPPVISVSNKLLESILFTVFSTKIKLVKVVFEPFFETLLGPFIKNSFSRAGAQTILIKNKVYVELPFTLFSPKGYCRIGM